MATHEEFLAFAKDRPVTTTANELPQDHVFDSNVLSRNLQGASALGELGDILHAVSPETQEILNTMSYMSEGEFLDDYSKIKIEDRNILNGELYKKDKEEVEALSSEMAAKRLSEEYNLDNAKSYIKQFNENQKKLESIEDPTFQKAVYATQDMVDATALNNMHRNYLSVCKKFNSDYLWHILEKSGKFELPKDRKISGLTTGVPTELRWADLQNYSNEVIADEFLKTKEDWINYTAAKKRFMHDKYGYPFDFVPGETFEGSGLVSAYPIVSGALAAATAPVKGAELGARATYAISGMLLDAPITTGLNEMAEGLSEVHPVISVGATVVAALVLGPRAEKALASAISKSSNVFVKPGNTLQQFVRLADFENIKLSDDMYDTVSGVVDGRYKNTQMEKLVPNVSDGVDDGLEVAYKAPQTEYNINQAEAVFIDKDNVRSAKSAIKQLEHNDMKAGVKDELERKMFSSYQEDIKTALANDDFDTAAAIVGMHLDDAYDRVNGMIDATKTYIPKTDPRWVNRTFINLLPPEAKATAKFNPNALVMQSAAVNKNADIVYSSIEKALKPHKWSSNSYLKRYNEIIRQADDGDIPDINKFIESENVPGPVADAVLKYHKLNDVMYTHANKALSDLLNKDGIQQYGKSGLVRVKDLDEGILLDVRTGEEFVGDVTQLGPVEKSIPYSQYFSHRHVQNNVFAVSIKDKVTGKVSTVDTKKSGMSAHAFKRKLMERGIGEDKEIIVHRIGDNPNIEHMNGVRSTMVNNPKETFMGNGERLLSMMHDLGISQVPRDMDEIYDGVADLYGLGKISGKTPKAMRKMERTRERALSHVADAKESFNSYTTMMTRALVEQPYINKFKEEFLTKYGKYLDDPLDYTSKLNTSKVDDPARSIERAGRLYQNQLRNMERVPHPFNIKTQEMVDGVLHRMYTSDKKLMRGLGRILEFQNTNMPITTTAKNLGYPMSLAMNVSQIPLQATFAHFGLIAHGDMFLKNPKLVGELAKDTGVISNYLMMRKMGLGKLFKLTDSQKAFVAEVDNAGYFSDILGTERGSGIGLIKGVTDIGMKPVMWGELGNKMMNVQVAFKKAAEEGLQVGTKEHRAFVSTYFPKYSQVLNHLTNSPLTTNPWTSWNVGMFKKFPLQWFDQFWYGDLGKNKHAKKIAFLGLGYAMYGKNGIPGMSDAVELGNMAEDYLTPIYINQVLEAQSAVENFTKEDAYKYIEYTWHDEPDRVAEEKAKFDEDFSKVPDIFKQLGDQKVAELLEGDAVSNLDAYRKVVMNMLNYEGMLENSAINIGWRSTVQQVRDFGVPSMFGPFANNVYRAHVGDAAANMLEAWGKVDQYGTEQFKKVVKGEGFRMYKALFPSPSKTTEGLLHFGELTQALNNEELTDASGKPLSFVDIFDDPSIELSIEYKEQKDGTLGYAVLKPTSTISDIGWRVVGAASGDVRERKKKMSDITKHYNNVLLPQLKRTAQLYEYYNSTEDYTLANELLATYRTMVYRKYGHTPIVEWVHRSLTSETQRINNKRFGERKAKKQIDRTFFEEIAKGLKERY